jgi:hypothetical protein
MKKNQLKFVLNAGAGRDWNGFLQQLDFAKTNDKPLLTKVDYSANLVNRLTKELRVS